MTQGVAKLIKSDVAALDSVVVEVVDPSDYLPVRNSSRLWKRATISGCSKPPSTASTGREGLVTAGGGLVTDDAHLATDDVLQTHTDT